MLFIIKLSCLQLTVGIPVMLSLVPLKTAVCFFSIYYLPKIVTV